MSKMNRRDFGKLFALSLTGAATGVIGAPSVLKASSKRVLVIGGGFGGATAARYVKKFDPSIDVTLVEPKTTFHTCPFSNWVIGGIKDMKEIGHSFKPMSDVHNVNVIHDVVTEIDPMKNVAKTKGGQTLAYDRAIVSPGVDFKWDAVEGYDMEASKVMPHAYHAGPQTELLRDQLHSMKKGGVVILHAPPNPFRCPPGPYERASLIAYYLKKNNPTGKVIILDEKEKFSKQALFQQGWGKLYGDLIEWRSGSSGGSVTRVDTKSMSLETEFGMEKGDVINFIPPQHAGKVARDSGLTNDSGWCPINQQTFESTIHANIHVIGDACIAGKMPKSGFAASSQAKIAALAVTDLMNGRSTQPPSLANTCYSLIGEKYAISVAAVYKLSPKGIVGIKGAGGLTPMDASEQQLSAEALYAVGWYDSLSKDIWG